MQPETLKEHEQRIDGAIGLSQYRSNKEARDSLDALVVEVERLTAELESKNLGGDKVASESGECRCPSGGHTCGKPNWQEGDQCACKRWYLGPNGCIGCDLPPDECACDEAGKSNPGDGEAVSSGAEATAERDWSTLRVFTSYPLLTIFAEDEDEAARTLYALEDHINATPGVSTFLDEECYERVSDEEDSEDWRPVREEATAAAGDERRHPEHDSPQDLNPGDSGAVREGSGGERVEWADLQAGDVVGLRVFSLKHGSVRETRTVVATDGKILTLVGDPERPGIKYEIVASEPDAAKRDLRRVSSTPSEPGSLPEPSPHDSPLETGQGNKQTGDDRSAVASSGSGWCPVCSALPDEFCTTPAGHPRDDHSGRERGDDGAS